MKKVFTISFIAISFLVCTNLYSQSLKLGIGGGPVFVQSSGLAINTNFNRNIDFNTSYQIGARIKVAFLIPFNLIGEVNYYKFKGDGTANLPVMVPPSATLTNNNVNAESKMWNVVVGGEYVFIPAPVVAPHLDVDLIYSSFGESTVTSVVNDAISLKADGKSRFGIGLGVGADITAFPSFDIGVNAKYNMHTLFGKEDGEDNLNTITLTVSILFDVI